MNFACGSQNELIAPRYLEGEKKGDELELNAPEGGLESLIITKPSESEIKGDIRYNHQQLETISLRPHTIITAERFEIAPLVKFDETRNWLKLISMDYMLKWKAKCTAP